MSTSIPHDELKMLAEKYSLTHVVMLANQSDPYMDYVVTYGDSVKTADQAAEFGNRLKDAMGWPESLHQQSAQVTERIAALEASLSALLDSAAHGQPGGYIEFDPNFPERRYCTYCGESWGINSQEWHDADCPVARARALLSK